MEMLFNPLGLTVEVVDIVFLGGDGSSRLLPLQEFLSSCGLDQANRGFQGRGILKRRVGDGQGPSPSSRLAEEKIVPGSTSFQFEGERVVEPPSLNDTFQAGTQLGFQRLIWAL